jgi:uncharacterized protein (TIGR03089 family)
VETPGGAFQRFTAMAERQPARYGHKPFLTWYDDARGERVELSFRNFDNWVAKIANLLAGELGVEPGDRVAAVLVEHWQAVAVLAACWRAGAGVVAVAPDAGPAAVAAALEGAAAAFVREEWVAQAAAAAGRGTTLVALTADLAGRSERDLGAALRFARVVPSMGDEFPGDTDPPAEAFRLVPAPAVAGAAPAGAAATTAAAGEAAGPPSGAGEGAGEAARGGGEAAGPAGAARSGAITMAWLLGEAASLVGRTGLSEGDRLLSGRGLLSTGGVVAGLLAPFGAGAGVVLVRTFEPARFWRLVADERVTVAALTPAQAGALLAAGPPPAGVDHSRLRLVACRAGPEAEGLGAALRGRPGLAVVDA